MGNNPKKILIVCHHYPPHITGVGIIAHNQAKNLIKLGNEVTVITSKTNKSESSGIIDGVNVIRVKANNVLERVHAPFPFFSPALLIKLYKNIKKVDIVHVHDAFYISSFFSVIVANWFKKPIVLTQHVSMVDHPSGFIMLVQKIVYSTTGLYIFKSSDLIMTYNTRVSDFILSKKVDPRKVINLNNGVDTDFYKPVSGIEKVELKRKLGLNPDKKTVLFVGRFVPKKGFDKVYNAQSDDYQIVFAGGEIDNLRSNDRVVFLGKLSKEQIKDVYGASDLFVLPSNSEGFPVSIQEAMASGLPIITSHDRGYDQYEFDREKFIMLEDVNYQNIKKIITQILLDNDRFSKMSEYSREYVIKNFSWCNLIKNLDEVYDQVIKNKNKIKIAFVSDAIFEFNKGGKEKRLDDIVRKFSDSGYSVTVYCMKWWMGGKYHYRDGVKYEAISNLYPLYSDNRRSITQGIFFSISCLKLLFKDFDRINVDHIPHLVLFTTKFVCIVKRKKMFVTWHEVWGKEYWKQYLGPVLGRIAYCIELFTSKLPNMIISVSDLTTKKLREVLYVKGDIITIPNGVNLDIITSAPRSPIESDVIFAGRLLPNKNIDVLIRAISILKDKGVNLKVSIIGQGPESSSLNELVTELGLANSVKFHGFLENAQDLYSMMKSSKMFVLPSDREGFGIVVVEANASGLPVITVDVPGNAAKDLIVQNENGLVCELNPKSVAESIQKLLKARSSSEKYVQFSKKYDWSSLYGRLESLYK